MGKGITAAPQRTPVKQFSVFADNKVGRMHDLVSALSEQDIHILGLATVDTTDSAMIRLIVDYWQPARNLFHGLSMAFALNDVVLAELHSTEDMSRVTRALMEAEINIHYMYPLLLRPNGHSGLVLRLEDQDLGEEVLRQSGIITLDHSDLAR